MWTTIIAALGQITGAVGGMVQSNNMVKASYYDNAPGVINSFEFDPPENNNMQIIGIMAGLFVLLMLVIVYIRKSK